MISVKIKDIPDTPCMPYMPTLTPKTTPTDRQSYGSPMECLGILNPRGWEVTLLHTHPLIPLTHPSPPLRAWPSRSTARAKSEGHGPAVAAGSSGSRWLAAPCRYRR